MTPTPRPNLLWRLFVIIGVASMTALVANDDAWNGWEDKVGDRIPRSKIRNLLVGTFGVHLVESALVRRSATRAGVDRPSSWARSAFFWGFPVALRLREANRTGNIVVVAD